MRTLTLVAVIAAAALLSGCGTINSYANGCGGKYSGLYTDLEYLGTYREFHDAADFSQVGFDVLLSTVLDTVALPVTAFLEPSANNTYGCNWAP
jgi:uncharacterized protein YceK